MILFLTALALGLAGSLHCAGMCGPLALALPIRQEGMRSKLVSILLYNSGRAISYSLLGIVSGFIGAGFSFLGWQQSLSIIAGIFVLTLLLFPQMKKLFPSNFIGARPYVFLKEKMVLLFRRKSFSSFFLIGMLNGLLPCGLVYIALTAAIAAGDWFSGALYMFIFGLGTIPVMFALLWFSHLLSLKWRKTLNNLTPIIVTVSAVLLILRGMNLGIPMLSPAAEGNNMKCCHTSTQCKP